ncbi:Methyltransferase type 11 [Dillenia turbinata]|uniref:Methyltransferase type 11 n=1 Tax=Dillenia turbinata TaxID=194707 RepID=A0AAN8W267_9MAGN
MRIRGRLEKEKQMRMMATMFTNNSPNVLLSTKIGYSSSSRRRPTPRFFKFNSSTPIVTNYPLAAKPAIRAFSASTVLTETDPLLDSTATVENKDKTNNKVLACPICYEPLISSTPILSVDSLRGATLQCNTCKKAYYSKEAHIDLTASSGAKAYGELRPIMTEFFRIPLVSFVYERGWRQSFSFWSGFPGPEKEFESAKEYLKPVLGGNIIDASCGSGLFSRLFAKSGLFSLVVALDFSENMLRQCYEFIKEDKDFPEEKLILVRADISRLPFVSSSVDAVHAGAALHCWPSPSTAVAEISRVLRRGGIFVATTYLVDGPFGFIPFLRPLRQNFLQISGSHVFLSEDELEDLCRSCGLVEFKCVRNRGFVMISATKPS